MSQLIETLFLRTWWNWNPRDGEWFSVIYHWFNIVEGVAWIVFAGLVLMRYAKFRNSMLEISYSIAFLAFGATDFREAWEQSSWLIWLKLLNLITLLWLRSVAIRRWYPRAKLY